MFASTISYLAKKTASLSASPFSNTKLGRILALLLITFVLAVPLIYLHLDSHPLQIQTSNGAASIFFAADRNRVIVPNECIVVQWEVERIQAVFLNMEGQGGIGEQERCTFSARPTLHVEFPDGTSKDYEFVLERLYFNPVVLALLAGLIVSSSAAVYTLFGGRGLLILVMVAVFAPMFRSFAKIEGDFVTHISFASAARDTGSFSALPPQFLFHLLLILIANLIPSVNLENASFLVVLAAYVLCAVAVYSLLRHIAGQPAHTLKLDTVFVGLTLAIMLAGPIAVFGPYSNPNASLIQFNAYHNPTIGLLKPFAVALFLLVLRLLTRPSHKVAVTTLALAGLTILATLAKPSYTLTIAPALALIVGASFLKPLHIPRFALILGVLVPAGLVLGWQYFFLYGPQAQSTVYNSVEPARLTFAPLELYLKWWRIPGYRLLPELVASILFPLVVYLAYFRQARRDTALNLAWLTFLVGAALAYLFVERPREGDGNLVWSGQITLFILFAVSVGFYLKQTSFVERLRFDRWSALCAIAFTAHVVSHLTILLR